MTGKKWFDPIEMMKDPVEAEKLVKYVLKFVAASWLFFFVIWAFYTLTTLSIRFDPAKAGQFGDTFGAINALFSGLALTGVAYAVLLQHQELKATNEQLEEARKEGIKNDEARQNSDRIMERQAVALLAAARLNATQALAMSTDEKALSHICMNGNVCSVNKRAVLAQNTRIILLELAGLEPSGEDEAPSPLNMPDMIC